jgi:hypothetical protein
VAGDWIKMRTNLDSDVRVIEMAQLLGISELHVVGCLWKLWSWADQHTHDGNAIRVTGVTLDRFTAVTGFADALRKVGWLEGRDGALTFPRFAEHNGQTAKNRAETKERVAKHRNAKAVTDVTQNPLPEKRRGEERRSKKQTNAREEVFLPEQFRTPEFAETWERWKRHRDQRQKPIASIEEEQQLMDLARFSLAEALEMIRFTIAKGALHLILNGDHARDSSTVDRPSRSFVKQPVF